MRSSMRASPEAAGTNSAPVSSLLDSMSELRTLIAKKEMELSSLAQSRAAASSSTSFAQTQVAPSSLAATVPSGGYYPTASPSPVASPMASPISAALQQSASLLQSQLQSQQAAHTQHELSLRDQEIHDSSIRILSLEQTLLEREEAYQELKAEAARLKKREESAAADLEVRSVAHKKQMELLHANLETLTWNRHDSLEKQRDEFERLRKEMMEELVRKEEQAHARQQALNQNLLNYEEQMRSQQQQMEEMRGQAAKDADKAKEVIQKLEVEVENLRAAKASSKDQLNSGIKQQLTMTSQLKSLSRKLEETQRAQENERVEYLTGKQRLEAENARVRLELEAKTEELLHHLRAVEAAMLESERAGALALQKSELEKEEQMLGHAAEREQLLEQAHAEKRALIDEFASKSNEAASALAASQAHSQHLERDLQEQRHRMSHEQALAQESWNNLVLEKERDIQALKLEIISLQQNVANAREHAADLDAQLTTARVDAAQVSADLRHAREHLEEVQQRVVELRAQHKHENEEKALAWNARVDELQLRLVKVERECEEKERALVVERARTSELTAQLQLLRTSSQNKVRAIEVARTLEQQALLSDFASQLSRVRTEIGHIKAQPTPKDRARSRSRRREVERERQADERERSRERSRERLRSPQPISMHQQHQQQAAVQSSPAKKHIRVRSIGDTGNGVAFSPATPHSPSVQFDGGGYDAAHMFGRMTSPR
jgi:hypothetical protein